MLLQTMQQQQQQQQQPRQSGGIMDIVSNILKQQGGAEIDPWAKEWGYPSFGGGPTAISSLGSSAGGASSASQAAWNAGGMSQAGGADLAMEEMMGNGLFSEAPGSMMMSQAPAQAGAFDLAGIGSAGNGILPVAGVLGTYDTLKNNRIGKRGYLQGMASGAAMGSYFGPWGALIGAGVGLGMGGANELLDTNRYKKEGNRLAELEKKGVKIPDSMKLAMTLERGRTKDELVNKNFAADFVGNDGKGGWVNNKFANSRDTNDLKKEDIWGYSAFSEKFGNDWWNKFSTQQRADIAQAALDNKAVKEHHGTIDINWNPQLDSSIKTILGNADGGNKPAPYKPGQSMDSFINYASAGLGNSAPPQAQQPQWRRGQTVRLSPGVYRGPDGKIQRGK